MKYLIQKHCVATELCTIALGRIQDYYYGTPKYHISRDFFPTEMEVDLYGFTSEAEARKVLEQRMKRAPLECGDGMWEVEYSIVTVPEV